MAKEIKPGKKFKYDLNSVLKVRAIREKREQETFFLKQKDYLEEKKKEEVIEEDKHNHTKEFKNLTSKGPINDFAKVLARRAHINILKENLDEQIEKVIDASQKMEVQREKLLVAMKDRKIMDKDKEHKKEKYDDVMKKMDIQFMDEIATLSFARKKRNAEEAS